MEKKITKIEEEMNRKIISCLLELLCSSSEYVSAEDLKELRAAKNKFASNKIETEALLTTVANARKNAVERMTKLVTAEMELKKTISETQKLVESWPASFKAALELRCTEDDSWLSVKEYGKDHCDTASEVEEEANQESKDRKNDSDSPDVEKNNEEKMVPHFHVRLRYPDVNNTQHTVQINKNIQGECAVEDCPAHGRPHTHENTKNDRAYWNIQLCSDLKCRKPHYHEDYCEKGWKFDPCDDENCTVLKPTDKLSEFAKDLPNRLKRPEYKPVRNVTE